MQFGQEYLCDSAWSFVHFKGILVGVICVVFIPSVYTLSSDKYVSKHINTSHNFTPIYHYLHLQTLQKTTIVTNYVIIIIQKLHPVERYIAVKYYHKTDRLKKNYIKTCILKKVTNNTDNTRILSG